MAWTGAESSGGGPLLDGVSTFLGDGGLGQRDREPLGSRGLRFLCSSVLPSYCPRGPARASWRACGAGYCVPMPLWWRAGRSTVAVRSARLPSMDGGRVGAVQSGAPLGTRRAPVIRRKDRRYPAATRRTAHADAPLSMGLRPSTDFLSCKKTTGRGSRAAAEHRPPRGPPAPRARRTARGRAPPGRRGKRSISRQHRTSPTWQRHGAAAPQVTLDGRITARVHREQTSNGSARVQHGPTATFRCPPRDQTLVHSPSIAR